MYQPQAEATMMKDDGKMVHNCAKHVEHAQYGKGNTIAEEHADPDRYGNIAWYDIEFPHGVERGVPVNELKVLASESHGHPTKKAKKMAEAAPGGSNAAIVGDPHQAIKQAAMDAAKAAANKTATGPGERDKITKQGVTKEEVEELDELKMKTMKSYYDKAEDSYHNSKDAKTRAKRDAGLVRADRKIDAKASKINPFKEDVDATMIHHNAIEIDLELTEADKGYDAYFKAMMKKHGINHPGEFKSDEEKKAFFNKVDAGFKAKNEDVFLEAFMASDLMAVKNAHKKAGNKISDEKSMTKDGQPQHSFVVTTPEGKRTRHVYHGTKKRLETMSPAARSKEAKEVGDDEDDK